MQSGEDAAEAEARARAYGLLADLVSRGPTAATLEAARLSPLLGEALAEYPAPILDGAASDHERVFGMELFPQEGWFLDAEGKIGGDATQSLLDLFHRAGCIPAPGGDGPEHLATALQALSFLSGAEADALADGLPEAEERIRALSRELLDGHLLRWLPVLCVSVRRCGRPFPSALASQIEDLVLLHREGLGPPASPGEFLAGPALDLDAEETGLGEIALHLTRPALAGAALTRADLARAGRLAEAPRGFGERAVELENLLRSAARLDRRPEALAALDGILSAVAVDLEESAGRGAGLEESIRPWLARIAGTRRLLVLLRTRSAAVAAEGAPAGETP